MTDHGKKGKRDETDGTRERFKKARRLCRESNDSVQGRDRRGISEF